MDLEKKQKGFTPTPKYSVYKSKDWRYKGQEISSSNIQIMKLRKKGFTFIELIIAIFIFSLMMIAVAGIFSNSFGGYRGARNIQKDLEDAQFVMNQIAKTLRTSSIVSYDAVNEKLIVYDYSNGKCSAYQFASSEIRAAIGAASPPADEDPVVWCSTNFSPSFSSENKMAAFFVEGRFYPVKSDNTVGSEKLGKVTIAMKICSNAGCSGDAAMIQTSVSLRDYTQAGI